MFPEQYNYFIFLHIILRFIFFFIIYIIITILSSYRNFESPFLPSILCSAAEIFVVRFPDELLSINFHPVKIGNLSFERFPRRSPSVTPVVMRLCSKLLSVFLVQKSNLSFLIFVWLKSSSVRIRIQQFFILLWKNLLFVISLVVTITGSDDVNLLAE